MAVLKLQFRVERVRNCGAKFFLGRKSLDVSLRQKTGSRYLLVNECLFTAKLLHSNGDLPQRDVWDVLGRESEIPVVLKPALASDWFLASASWQADLIALMMLTQIRKPAPIFEIGTLHGCSALHFALNAPAQTYLCLTCR
jgi:hypothetical protein